jgi:hypothetical protein
MSKHDDLIPPAPIVRERLSRNLRERRRLRSLLRLAVQAAQDRAESAPHESRRAAAGRGVAQ